MEEAISMIRACVMPEKDGVLLRNLNRDFQSVVGHPIPFQQYGYKSLEDFLKGSNSFLFKRDKKGDMKVHVAPNEKSNHIQALILKQKTKKKKSKRSHSVPVTTKPVTRYYDGSYPTSGQAKQRIPLRSSNEAQKRLLAIISSGGEKSAQNMDVRGLPLVKVEATANKEADRTFERKKSLEDVNEKEVPILCQQAGDNMRSVSKEKLAVHLKKNVVPKKERAVKEDLLPIPSQPTFNASVPINLKVTVTNNGRQVEESQGSSSSTIFGYTLFGDDFFTSLLSEQFKYPFTITNNRRICGLSRNGLTLQEAIRLVQTCSSLPEKVVLLVGAVDILQKRNLESITKDIYTLVQELSNVVRDVAVCTIPPLIGENNFLEINRHEAANCAINCIPGDLGHKIKIIDLCSIFKFMKPAALGKLFRIQINHPPVVWNELGQELIISTLKKELK